MPPADAARRAAGAQRTTPTATPPPHPAMRGRRGPAAAPGRHRTTACYTTMSYSTLTYRLVIDLSKFN